jgi:translation initiation factor IF-2
MGKKRLFELAKEIGMSNKDLLAKALAMGFDLKSHMSTLDEFQIDKIKRDLNLGGSKEIVEKRVTQTVIRRRVQKETAVEAKPVLVEEPVDESDEEKVAEEVDNEKVKPEVSKEKVHVARSKEPKSILKIIKKAEEPKPKAKEEPKEKPKKGAVEKVIGEFSVKAQVKPDEKPKYQKLKVIPLKEIIPDTEALAEKKEQFKAEKIKKLRERFKPAADLTDIDLYPIKGFEKIKKRKKREVIDIKDLKGGKYFKKRRMLPKKGRKTELTTPKAIKRVIKIGGSILVGELAKRMSVKASELIAKLMSLGTTVTINQSIDFDTAQVITSDFGFTVEQAAGQESEIMKKLEAKGSGEFETRPPVVTVMGHVDHGKTSLLDKIRNTNVTEGEAGGITQRIGAYSVNVKNSKIVFIDTPGHEAFTSMRARGAKVTDIVVLVVAADDGVMPQTIEAINHAKEAKVPILVAINKVDKSGVNPERVKQSLTEYGLVPEEWGGENIFINVSAKTGQGVPELLDLLLLQAEVLDLKSDPKKMMKGVVIESRLDKGKGPIATVIVQEGYLKVGQPIIVGREFGRVRAMLDEFGKPLDLAGPSTPVEIQGLSGIADAGETCNVIDDEKLAKQISELRQRKGKEGTGAAKTKVSLEELYSQIQRGNLKELKVVTKADTVGSVEAINQSLTKLGNETVGVKCIHEGVGGVTEGDVMLASASNAIIVAFNVRMESGAQALADREKVSVKFYNIIYNAIDDVKKAIEGLLEPKSVEKTIGKAQVKEVFNISKLGAIAGSLVVDGKIQRNAKVRLLRDSSVVLEGAKISSLKRFKDDVRDVPSGMECGIGIENFNDLKIGDIIECYEIEQVKSVLL